mmetsp:Transcript_87155/g.154307  ORF Transcript_87155/g.154307 Transcript_87155/m.154307 type:complete len:580 (+) Transcript_87155:60-1799(+)|eukprot:CAMPEP_0197659228 /NCGR_PEP_ID=MMETSP1338-20131121/46757_1 /TAXON_ID=43686 ORGANISM="Pelagodinium beii, Strain RCC1491" /NCGR_SAMPLE_ID=MMETSP1338 /ASSEMBLY_ACC=CAM_ASM_000754 /LENGTH=579 /DNA_ID=CAMNT_0043236051 /DNA_START=44 /DNA_END=1783 /DNA_ORIENTATION=-
MASADKLNCGIGQPELNPALQGQETVLLQRVLMPFSTNERKDVLISGGRISKIACAGSLSTTGVTMDCTERLLMPGFVNAHTHSIEHWTKGLIKPLPLELWVQQLIRKEPRGQEGWEGEDSFLKTPSSAVGLSAMHCGVESLLSGCTAVLDHLFIRNMEDLAAAVDAYKAVGVRAFISPMLNDDAEMYTNYIPLVPDAADRNCHGGCCGMGENGEFRTKKSPSDPEKTAACLKLWEEAVQRFHDPKAGIEIVIGPVTVYSASEELLRGAAQLRKKYNLCGHTHLLETRSQALQARQWFKSGSAVQQLKDTGFLDGRGTSLAHSIWLSREEQRLCAETGAVLVHNPLSNLRLGSGVAPLLKYAAKGIAVAIGTDGSASSDGQDLIEALKLASFLPRVTTPDYRAWPSAREMALENASKNGYRAIGMPDGGELKEGMVADVSLWDLSSLALLPRTDPVNLLVMGSRTQAPGAGSTLACMWVRGVRVVKEGAPCGVDLQRLRAVLAHAQRDYRDPESTDPSACTETLAFETEYRAALQLDGTSSGRGEAFSEDCVLYSPTLKAGHEEVVPNGQCGSGYPTPA